MTFDVQGILPCWTHDGNPTELLQINKQVEWFKQQLKSNPTYLQGLVAKYFKARIITLILVTIAVNLLEMC